MAQDSPRRPRPAAPDSAPVAPPPKKKRESRAAREARQKRLLKMVMIGAAVLVLVVLGAGIINQYVLKPQATLATVNGVPIKRVDYWKARASDLNAQASQYAQFAQFVGPEQSGQFETMAQQALDQIPEVYGSTRTDPGTLNKMIEDQLFLQGAEKMGLGVTPEEAETWALAQFSPADAPLLTPVPTPTYIPERAEMMTATAAAELASEDAAAVVPGTPAGTPEDAAFATPIGSPVSSETPAPEATPSLADARATAASGFAEFGDAFFPAAHMSREDYLRLVAAPQVARDHVQTSLAGEIGQTEPMVEASHILVETKDLADKLEADLAGGADFGELAKANSTDTGTAGNGGDLGWFTREEMVKPFADAAFAMKPNETSAPVKSDFGWHIIEVRDNDPERPLTDAQITRIEQARTAAWLDEQRAQSSLTSSLPATPVAAPGSFSPPLNAPPAPPMDVPEPVANATPIG